MRLSFLGSENSAQKREMSKEGKELPLKKQTNQNKESSLGAHGVPCPPWRIFLGEQEYTEEQLGIDFSNPLSKAIEKCAQTLSKGGELSEEKKTEAKSLSNYIPQSQKSIIREVLGLLSRLFRCQPPNLPSTAPFESSFRHLPKLQPQLSKTCKNKLLLCYSNKWRQIQSTIYLLIHHEEPKSPKLQTQRQQPVRIQILNQRGLILQTISNLKQLRLQEQIAGIVKKHYRKVQYIVLVSECGEKVHLDRFQYFCNEFQGVKVAMVNWRRKDSLGLLSSESIVKIHDYPLLTDSFLMVYGQRDIFVMSNFITNPVCQAILSRVPVIVATESLVASFFQEFSYFSTPFSQKQLLLRLFAFNFNFATLSQMKPEDKNHLLKMVVESEVSSLKSKEQHQNRLEKAKVHTYITHPSPLVCSICKRRTKIKCQKCCLDFNRYFGLCEKQCFSSFHSDIPKYRSQALKSKQIISHVFTQEVSEEREAREEAEFGSSGRKRVKTQQLFQKDQTNPQSDSLDTIKQKWANTLTSEQAKLSQLTQYTELGLNSSIILLKLQHLMKRGNQMQTILQQTNNTIVKEEYIQQP